MLFVEWGTAALKTLPGITVVLLYSGLLWYTVNKITPFNDHDEIFNKRNYAYLVQRLSLVAAQIIAMLAVLPDFDVEAPWWSALWLALEGLYVFVAILVARFVVDWAILPKVNNTELIRSGNMAISVVEAGFYVGLGFILKGSLTGVASSSWLSFTSTVVFFAAGLAFVVGVFWIHELVTRYDLRGRLREGNLTAAIEAGSFVLGASIVVSVGVAGDFISWPISFRAFFVTALIGVIMLYIVRWLIDLVIVRGHTIKSIQETDNVPAATLVGTLMVLVALPVAQVLAYVI